MNPKINVTIRAERATEALNSSLNQLPDVTISPIKAYCEVRLRFLKTLPANNADSALIDELEHIVRLCDGLHSQFVLMEKALPLRPRAEETK